MATLYEHYNTGDDDVHGVDEADFLVAETYTPQISHTLTSIKLIVYRVGLPGTIHIGIKATDVDGKPTGPDLDSASFDGDTLTTDTDGELKEIPFTGDINQLIDTKYAIAVEAPDAESPTSELSWRMDSSSPTYTRGGVYVTTDGGLNWTERPGEVLMFEEWGDPIVVTPSVTTDPASALSAIAATLEGTPDYDGGEACDCGLEWGLDTGYGTTTPTESKTTGEPFSQVIGGLFPNTTYHFRAFATNSVGTGYGADRTFTTALVISRAFALAREEL